MIPVAHHAEQKWNARDAVQAGLARASHSFDLELLSSLPESRDNAWFRDWVARGQETFSALIDAALAAHGWPDENSMGSDSIEFV